MSDEAVEGDGVEDECTCYDSYTGNNPGLQVDGGCPVHGAAPQDASAEEERVQMDRDAVGWAMEVLDEFIPAVKAPNPEQASEAWFDVLRPRARRLRRGGGEPPGPGTRCEEHPDRLAVAFTRDEVGLCYECASAALWDAAGSENRPGGSGERGEQYEEQGFTAGECIADALGEIDQWRRGAAGSTYDPLDHI